MAARQSPSSREVLEAKCSTALGRPLSQFPLHKRVLDSSSLARAIRRPLSVILLPQEIASAHRTTCRPPYLANTVHSISLTFSDCRSRPGLPHPIDRRPRRAQDDHSCLSRPLHPRGPPNPHVSLLSCARNARKAKTQRAHTHSNSTFAPVVVLTFHLSHVTEFPF